MIAHDEIAALIPHAGRMCLLARVLDWDDQGIRCAADSHRATDNPLREGTRLGILAGLEYAAQAMAVHGALLARARGEQLPPGYLAAVRDARFERERLDDLEGDLIVRAERLLGGGGHFVYAADLEAVDGTPLLSARITVVEQPEAAS